MSWISEFMTPKIKALIGISQQEQDSDVLWTKCKQCGQMEYSQELAEDRMVCKYCGYHGQISASTRFAMIFDNAKYEKVQSTEIKDDPIKFKDMKKYTDRLKEARKKTGNVDACSIACGNIGSKTAVVFVIDFSFMGGSMGLSVGKSFVKAIKIAMERNAAFITFTASGGARMQEGILSLMQMASTTAAVCMFKTTTKPFINVLTNPTTGGVLASFAMLGDINIAEPKALIGFAGARVIEKLIKQKLPEGFQRSEFLKDRGMIDIIANRKELTQILQTLLAYMVK
jgi:acetyl-CoA carboxylase carboxyl transferase subunit beta